MISTFQALLVALVAVLPGALYTIAREHRTAAWSLDDAAREVIRFLAVSAAFHALLAPITFYAYCKLIKTGALANGQVSLWWWPVLLLYVFLPFVLGEVTARSRRWGPQSVRWKRWMRIAISLYTATSPEPRAWDRVFSMPEAIGLIRLQLADGTWKAGPFDGDSYASNMQGDQDLYLADQVELTEDGHFVVDSDQRPRLLGVGLLIRWSEVRYAEISRTEEGGDDAG